MTVLSTLLHLTNFKTPLLRTLVPSIALAYGIQAAVAAPSILGQTERFYDLSGSLTYLSCTALSLYLPVLRARAASAASAGVLSSAPAQKWPSLIASALGRAEAAGRFWNWRQLVLSAAVGIWATRLGSYLFLRVLGDGEDSRFEKIRYSPPKFFGAFMAQATWVTLCALPVLTLNSLPVGTFALLPKTMLTDILGLALFIGGLAFEITADRQKAQWSKEKKEKKHSEDFLTRGLWSKSRHPNYFGEIALWSGIAVACGGVLVSGAGQRGLGVSGGVGGRVAAMAMAAASPAFVAFLLLKVSGVPLSEEKYDKRYGHRKDYMEWKRNTPVLVPKIWG